MAIGEGLLKVWGDNAYGKLGDNTTTSESTPIVINPTSVYKYAISAVDKSFSVDYEGYVYGWGRNPFYETPPVNYSTPVRVSFSRSITAISGINDHFIAKDYAGMLWSWGDPTYGKLGDGLVSAGSPPVSIARYASYAEMSAGWDHSLALDTQGRIWAWGRNANGELGIGTTTDQSYPTSVSAPVSFKKIAAAKQFSVGIDSGGNLWTWGLGTRLGLGASSDQSTPQLVTALHPDTSRSVSFVAVSAWDHVLALSSDGNIWVWGGNSDGQLGDGPYAPPFYTPGVDRSYPYILDHPTVFSYVCAGARHSMAIDQYGHVYGWGYNASGALGDGTTTSKDAPSLVISYGSYLNISAGDDTTLSLRDSPVIDIEKVKEGIIQMPLPDIKHANPFTTIGWVRRPGFIGDDPLVLLAIADPEGTVLDTDAAFRFELLKEDEDCRMQILGSKSKLIRKTTGIDLFDLKWHFLSYVCTGQGAMTYYVDGVLVGPEDGLDEEGIPYATARSRSFRVGGGDVWCPYLSIAGQDVTLYNWRMVVDVVLHHGWLEELRMIDYRVLYTETT